MIKRRIPIGGHKYKVQEISKARMNRLSKGSIGLIDFETLTIFLIEGLEGSKKEQVLAHEVMHALLEESGAHNFLKEDSLEPFVEGIENTFWSFLKDGAYFYD
jgi:Zn-dependent peptidase ImmA (M78 family)